MTKQYRARWRSPKAEQRYRQLDAKLWQRDLIGRAPESIDIATDFGSTRVYRWPGSGSPVVLLHGMGDTSIRWIPYAEKLVDHDVYAIDIMGDVGASTPDIGFTSATGYTDWLQQAIAKLGITEPTVVGYSLGGYLALSYAGLSSTGAPPVASTVLFDPVGVVKLRLGRFTLMGLEGLVGSLAPDGVRNLIGQRRRQPLLLDKEGLHLYTTGQRGHPPKIPPLPVFTDEQLGSIRTPVRAVIGARTTIFDVQKMADRITSMTNGHAQLVPDAGHGLVTSHPDACMAAIRSALGSLRDH